MSFLYRLRYPLPLLTLCTLTQQAHGASMVKVEQSAWTEGTEGLPSYVNMYIYVPDEPAASPPIVVAPHHCQGSAMSTLSEMASLVAFADSSGFLMIMPEATGQNCWDAGSERSLAHGGGGDTGAIVQMVEYAIAEHGADRERVYVVGGSSGGIMTEALLGVYPDVFRAGVSLMGVPCGCWAEGYNDVTGNGSTAQWSSCAGGTVMKSAEQWAALVRSYFPEYSGPRPRLQHWHGVNDTVINYKVVEEDIKEWTQLLDLTAEPDLTDTSEANVTREVWKSPSCDFAVYEVFRMAGVAHNVPTRGAAIAAYFGLEERDQPDPEAAACGEPSGGGSGGSGNGGGPAGSGGLDGTGGHDPSSGGDPNGGAPQSGGQDGASDGGTGGAAAMGGGSPGLGGATSSGVGGIGSGVGGSNTGGSGAGSGPEPADGSGCACATQGQQRREGGWLWASVVALGSAFARLRRERRGIPLELGRRSVDKTALRRPSSAG